MEKFNRDSSKDANDDIACREFSLVTNELHLKYHYAKGHVTASTRDFCKPSVAEIDDEIFNQNFTIGYQAEIGAKPPKNLQLFYLLESLLKDEQEVMHHVREREDEVFLLNTILVYFLDIISKDQTILVIIVFDKFCNFTAYLNLLKLLIQIFISVFFF